MTGAVALFGFGAIATIATLLIQWACLDVRPARKQRDNDIPRS